MMPAHMLTYTIDAPTTLLGDRLTDPPAVYRVEPAPDFARVIRPTEPGTGARLQLFVKGGGGVLFDGWTSRESLASTLDYLRSRPTRFGAFWQPEAGRDWESIGIDPPASVSG